MLVMALALLAAAPDAHVAPPWRLDLPLALVAQAPTSGVDTRVVPWMGARAARLLDHAPGELLMLGGDVTGWLGIGPNEGTSAVKASRLAGALEARGLLGVHALETATMGIRPYAYASALGGGAVLTLSVYDDSSMGLTPVWGLGCGAGIEIVAHLLSLRAELGAGVRDGGFALSSTMAAGVAF